MLHRRTKNKARTFILGMLLALLLTQPVTGQFTVNINSDTSPTTFQGLQLMGQQLASQVNIATDSKQSRISQALEHIKTAQRWIESVEQYTNMILGNVRRFTSLKGILTTVEKTLGLSDDTLKALRDVGEVIRGAITLKNSFISLVRTRLQMIESLAARARNGIFNPEADLRDLEEYLLYSLGREAGARLASRQRLAEIDPLIERLTYELQKVRAERAAKITEYTNIKAQLDREGGLLANARAAGVDGNGASTTVFGNNRQSLSPEAVQTLTLRAGQLEQQIAWYDEQERKLMDELQARYEEMQKNYTSAYLKGRYWQSVIQGWEALDEVKQRELENMIDGYGNGSPSGTPAIP